VGKNSADPGPLEKVDDRGGTDVGGAKAWVDRPSRWGQKGKGNTKGLAILNTGSASQVCEQKDCKHKASAEKTQTPREKNLKPSEKTANGRTNRQDPSSRPNSLVHRGGA